MKPWFGCALFVVLTALVGVSFADVAPVVRLGLLPVSEPADNRADPARVALGEAFFFDERLSKSGRLSCGSCHQPAHAYADGAAISAPDGEPRQRRNSMSLINVAYRPTLGWDGAALTLEEQIENSFSPWGDMGLGVADALARISADEDYVRQCREAYATDVDARCLTYAIAAFERSLVSSGSRFDRFLFAREEAALTASERRGWDLFNGRAGCINCHDVFHPSVNALGGAYATFSDERFHNLGVGYGEGRMRDTGRYEITRDAEEHGAFKTPMLRNVALTAPYMHDGSFDTLESVIEFYNEGGRRNPRQSRGLRPLFLTAEEEADIVAFLRALNSDYPVPTGGRGHAGRRRAE